MQYTHLTGNGIGTAGTYGNGGNTVFQSLLKGTVQRVNSINGSNLRGGGVGHFIGIIPLKIQTTFPNADMAMRIDKARSD